MSLTLRSIQNTKDKPNSPALSPWPGQKALKAPRHQHSRELLLTVTALPSEVLTRHK